MNILGDELYIIYEQSFAEIFLNFRVNDTNTNRMRPERKKEWEHVWGRKITDVGHLDMQPHTTIPALN